MANVLLTSKCNRSCPYCFAEKEMAGSPPGQVMSWANLIYIADFLHASGERRVSLLGGEPTLHADFVDFVLYLVERNFDVTVFTNGILSRSKLSAFKTHLTGIPRDRLQFVCNLNDPEQTPAPRQVSKRIEAFLALMGPWTSPGFNIYRTDFNLAFLFDLVNRYGMKRDLRLGITHPLPGASSAYIRPDEMGVVAKRLYDHRELFERLRIRPGLDCGFPLCQFSDEQLGWLYRQCEDVHFGCGPAVDISPDMNVYCCFPFSQVHKRSIFEFDSLNEITDYYTQILHKFREELPGIYRECDGCIHLENRKCDGGGACQILNRLVDEAPVRLPDIESELHKIRMPS